MERCLPDFKTESFLIKNYQKPIRRDRNEFDGDLMQFIRIGMVCKQVSTFESPDIESICSDLIVCKKRWVTLAFTDINIGTHDIQHSGSTKFNSFCNIFGLSDLV